MFTILQSDQDKMERIINASYEDNYILSGLKPHILNVENQKLSHADCVTKWDWQLVIFILVKEIIIQVNFSWQTIDVHCQLYNLQPYIFSPWSEKSVIKPETWIAQRVN